MNEEILKILRKDSRENMGHIWKCARDGKLEDLSEEEKKWAKIMLEHEEYANQFEFADVLHDYEFDPDTQVNPFLHITFHVVVENQLEGRDPIEVYQFYNAMRKKKLSRHDVIHLITNILIPLVFEVLKKNRPFDLEKYRSLLKIYKDRKPKKIIAELSRD